MPSRASSQAETGLIGHELGQTRGERAGRGHQRADETVAGEERRPLPVADRLRQERLLGWQEDADVAGGGVEGADEGDDQQRPEVMDEGEAEPGGDHQQRGAQEEQLTPEPVGDETDQQRQGGRAEEGRRRHRADLEPVEPERGQVEGQEDADEAVAEGPHCAGAEQHAASDVASDGSSGQRESLKSRVIALS